MSLTLRWAWTLIFMVTAGYVVGRSLDLILFEVSYDYVYAPGLFTRRSWSWNLILATFTSALVLHIPAVHKVRFITWTGALITSFLMFMIIALMTAVVAAFTAKHMVVGITSGDTAPAARVIFCQWLIRGTVLGAVAGNILFLTLIYNFSRRSVLSITNTGAQAGTTSRSECSSIAPQ